MRTVRQLLPLLALSVLVACAQKVQAPVANAGADVSVNTGAFVRLDGTGSKDAQGRALAYAWTFASRPLGSTATLTDDKTATPSFLADVPGPFVVQLIVSNSVLVSSPATVTVTATTCGATAPVINSISSNKAKVNIGDAVQLSADVTDADNAAGCNQNQTLTYAWSLIQQPAGSAAALNSATSETPSLTADTNGDYTVRLTVKDSTGLSSVPKTFTFSVANCGANVPTVTASANPTTTKPTGLVQLTATASDADIACGVAQTFTYQWTIGSKPAASTAVLSNSTLSNPTITPDQPGDYELSVTATDNTNKKSAPAVVVVTATTCGQNRPTVDGISQSGGSTIGTAITLGAVNTKDTNCLSTGALRLQWTLTAPAGSIAALSDATAAAPTFTPDVVGTYQLGLTVKNSLNQVSDAVSLNIPVGNCTPQAITFSAPAISYSITDPDANAPAASVADNGTPNVGGLLRLTPHATVPAYCGSLPTTPITYSWSISAKPAGSTAALDSTSANVTSFRTDKVGAYRVSVTATDARGQVSAPRVVDINTTNCGQNPITAQLKRVVNGFPADLISDPANPVSIRSLEAFGIGAVLVTADNDAAQCPVRFALAADFTWSVASQPAIGTGQLTNLSGPLTSFTAQTAGAYTVKLDTAVTNASGRVSAAPAFAYFAANQCGANAPQITNTLVTQGAPPVTISRAAIQQPVFVHAAAFDADAQAGCALADGGTPGGTLSYIWTAVSVPTGSTVAGRTEVANGADFTFTPDVAGTFTYSVVAKDDTNLSSQPRIVTIPTGSCGPTFDFTTSTPLQVGTKVNASPTGLADICVANATFTYAWTLTGRPANSVAILSAGTGANDQAFTPDLPGDYVLQLVVTDQGGFATSVSHTLHLGACDRPVLSNLRYTVGGNAGTAFKGDKLDLAVNVTPGQCGATSNQLTYSWALAQKPQQSASALTSAAAVSPSFIADVFGGAYLVTVRVTDGFGQSSDLASLPITISACGSGVPVASFSVSQAAGAQAFDPYTLTAGAVTNPDDNLASCPARFNAGPYTFAWSVVSPPNAVYTLDSASGSPVVFSPGGNASYTLQLIATGANGHASAPVTHVIDVACSLPGFTIGAPAISAVAAPPGDVFPRGTVGSFNVFAGDRVTVAAAVTSTCRTTNFNATYQWTLLEKPLGSTATLNSATLASPSLTIDSSGGTYKLQVQVTDSLGNSATSTVLVITSSTCGKNAITAVATDVTGGTPSPFDPRTVQVTASSVDDNAGLCPARFKNTYSYAWSIQAATPAIGGTFSAATSATTGFNPGGSATYTLAAAVTASSGQGTVATVGINAVCGATAVTATAIGATFAGDNVGSFPARTRTNLYRDDVVSLSTVGASGCFSAANAGLKYVWTLTDPAGSSSTLTAPAAANTAFTIDLPNGSWTASVVVKDALNNSSAPQTATFSSASCGANPILADFTDTPGAQPFDDHTFTATFAAGRTTFSDDDDQTKCPAHFALTYSKDWSVPSSAPNVGFVFDSTHGSPVKFTPGGNAVYNVKLVVSSGARSVSVLKQVTISCPDVVPKTGALSFTTTTPGYPGKAFRGDTVSIAAAPTSICFTPGNTPYTYAWIFTKPAGSPNFSSTTDAVPTFFADKTSATWTAKVTVTDKLGNVSLQSAPISITTENCGSNPTILTAADATPAGAKAFDVHTATFTASSVDDDSLSCPARFANATYNFTGLGVNATGGGRSNLTTSVTAKVATVNIEPGDNQTYTATATATATNANTDKLSASATKAFVINCATVNPVVQSFVRSGQSAPAFGDSATQKDFNNGDVISLASTVVTGCFTNQANAGLTQLWRVNGVALAANTFTVDAPAKAFVTDVVATDKWGHASALFAQTFNSSSCGASVVTIPSLVDSGVAHDFDVHTLSASASSKDDSGSACPAKFANASYTFNWSYTGGGRSAPVFPVSQAGIASGATTSTPFAAGDSPSTYSFTVAATGNKTGVTGSATKTIGTSCNPTPVVLGTNISISALTANPLPTSPHLGDTGGDFNNGNHVALAAAVDTTACWSDPLAAGLVRTWTINGNANPNNQFDATAASTSYVAGFVATDKWGHANAEVFRTFASSSCGKSPISVSASDSRPNGIGEFDKHLLAAVATSADHDPVRCPAAFDVSFSYAWSATKAGAGRFTLTPAAGTPTSFTAGDNDTYTVRVTASSQLSSNNQATGAAAGVNDTTITTNCGAPNPVVSAISLDSVTSTDLTGPARNPAFFRDDTLHFSDTTANACYSAATAQYTHSWTANAAPFSVLATPAFLVTQAATTYTIGDVVTDQWNRSSSLFTRDFTSGSCGANPFVAQLVQSGAGKPRDPVTVTVQPVGAFYSADDDITQCPNHFARDVIGAAFSLAGTPPPASLVKTDTFKAVFQAQSDFNYTIHVDLFVTGNTVGGSAETTVDGTCAAPTAPTPVIAKVNGADYANQTIFAGDTVDVATSGATSACFNNPTFAYGWQLKRDGSPANGEFTPPNPAPSALPTATLVPQGAPASYQVFYVLNDGAHTSTADNAIFRTPNCGGGSPQLTVVNAKQTIASVTRTVSGQFNVGGQLAGGGDPSARIATAGQSDAFLDGGVVTDALEINYPNPQDGGVAAADAGAPAGIVEVPFYLDNEMSVTVKVEDPQGTACGSYALTNATLSGPPGSVATITDFAPTTVTSGDTLTFHFKPDVGSKFVNDVSVPGDYSVSLGFTTPAHQPASETTKPVRVEGRCGLNAPVAAFAINGGDGNGSGQVGASVSLDGSLSSDADNQILVAQFNGGSFGCGLNQPLTYTWQMTSTVTPLPDFDVPNGANTPGQSFTPTAAGQYDLTLVVNDSTELVSDAATGSYTANADQLKLKWNVSDPTQTNSSPFSFTIQALDTNDQLVPVDGVPITFTVTNGSATFCANGPLPCRSPNTGTLSGGVASFSAGVFSGSGLVDVTVSTPGYVDGVQRFDVQQATLRGPNNSGLRKATAKLPKHASR